MAALAALIFSVVCLLQNPALGQAWDLSADKRTKLEKYLTARGAFEAVQGEPGRILFLDIRTRAEVMATGMTAKVDGHVPYLEIDRHWKWDDSAGRFKLDLNRQFDRWVLEHLKRKGLSKDDKIILMSASGDLSANAANRLADLGYTNVFSIIDGFEGDLTPEGRREVNGWKNSLLPWSYKLDKSKIYLAD